ncbi:MAG TPA: DUF2207 domain-containing protein [Candidatus Solibacter sp.]|nr:DUF2207 domain-containing protein [Candidatus Solibacter sp.]
MRPILGRFALLLAALLCALPLAAGTITFEHWSDELQVNADSSLEVTETLTVRFTVQRQGITRTIPLQYHTDQGFDYELNVRVESVTDGDFHDLRYEQNRTGGKLNLKIYVPGAKQATRTVILKYRVANGLRFFQDHDELYWNVTGNDHDNTIEQTDARVSLPAGASGVRTRAFTGRGGSRESNADITQGPDAVRYTASQPLRPGEGLTIVTGWDKGLVHEPGGLSKAWDFFTSNWPLGIPVLALMFALTFYFSYGRDPALRPVSVQYAPPQGMSPAGAGALIDDSADMRDITATIVDLAVRGYLTIEERTPTGILKFASKKEYVFHRKKTQDQWGDLRPHEHALMSALFGGAYGDAESVKLSDLHNTFYTNVPLLRDAIFAELMTRNCYRTRPDSMHHRFAAGAVAAGIAIFWTGKVISRHSGMQILPFVIAAGLTAVIVFIYGRAVHARTLEGTRALEGVLGFKEFLSRVESDRYNLVVKTPQMFEKFLPYAMAFACEAHWSKAFDGIYTQPPQWYSGPGYGPQFQPSLFASDLTGMANSTGNVMTSAPSSSGSSGFGGSGGGGFSGGGFGGGGAGEF